MSDKCPWCGGKVIVHGNPAEVGQTGWYQAVYDSSAKTQCRMCGRGYLFKKLAALPPSSGGEAKKCEGCDGTGWSFDGEAWEQDRKCPYCQARPAPAPSDAKHNSSGKLKDCAVPAPSEVEADKALSWFDLRWIKTGGGPSDDDPPEWYVHGKNLAASLRRAREELAEAKTWNTRAHAGCNTRALELVNRAEKVEAELAALKESASFRIQELGARLNATKLREEELAKEVEEQARLNGMGSEREARLMARVAELEKENAENERLADQNGAAVLAGFEREKTLRARVAELEKGER